MHGWIASILAFIEAHKEWTFWIALAFAFGETLALVSILIPSTAILVGVGAIVATGAIDFLPLWAGAATGAAIGSSVSWWLGMRYGQRILDAWPMSRYPENTQKGVAAFRRWGLWAVLIGHFFGPLRSVVFLMAGISRMGFVRFQLVNLPGCVAWAWFVPKFGELGGRLVGWFWSLLGF